LNFQKTILYQALNLSFERVRDQHDLLFLKYQFWVLKVLNKQISSTGNTNPVDPITPEDVNQSLNHLINQVNINQYSEANPYLKSMILKTAYELGYYYFLLNESQKLDFYFNFCIDNLEEFMVNNPSKKSSFYFDADSLKNLLLVCRENEFLLSSDNNILQEKKFKNSQDENVEMTEIKWQSIIIDFSRERNFVQEDFNELYPKITLSERNQRIIDVSYKYLHSFLEICN
jgi:hypothetical protein